MRKKVKQKEEKKLTYTTWQNTLYIFRGVFRWCKPLLIFMSIGAVTETAIPFIGLFLGKLVIEQVEKGAKTGQLLSTLVVVALLEIFVLCLNNLAQNQSWPRMIYVRMKFILLRMAKSMNMNYENLERPEMLDRMRKAEKIGRAHV